jgi:L-cysteine S-thiosulfotransferase
MTARDRRLVLRLRAGAATAVLLGLSAAGADEARPVERRSGFEEMSRDIQAMQRDDDANPGMLWVQEGEALWHREEGPAAKACADCHGGAADSMRGVAARYPAFDPDSGLPIDLQGRINRCRQTHQGRSAFAWESEELLALTAFIAHQSRGMPIAAEDPRLAPFRENGRRLFEEQRGQLDLSCAQCHDANAGGRLGGSVIPQGHPTGYPVYRLEWQSLGSLQRRLRNCMAGVRSEPYAYGSAEHLELELFLMFRANGMAMETPAVRP